MKNSKTNNIQSHSLSAVHLAPYLPYELRFSDGTILYSIDIDNELMLLDTKTSGISNHRIEWGNILPVLRPISDLDLNEFVENIKIVDLSVDDFVNGGLLRTFYHLDLLENYEIMSELFKNHFDVFGLIEKGLAIDINTLSVE